MGGLRYSHKSSKLPCLLFLEIVILGTNTFSFSDSSSDLQVIFFLHPLPRLRQTYPTPTSSNWPHYNNLQKQQGSLLLFKICHPWLRHSYPYDQPLLSRELSKLPTSPRGVGAHPLATGHPRVQQSPKTTGLCITFAHLSLGFATLTHTTNHFFLAFSTLPTVTGAGGV